MAYSTNRKVYAELVTGFFHKKSSPRSNRIKYCCDTTLGKYLVWICGVSREMQSGYSGLMEQFMLSISYGALYIGPLFFKNQRVGNWSVLWIIFYRSFLSSIFTYVCTYIVHVEILLFLAGDLFWWYFIAPSTEDPPSPPFLLLRPHICFKGVRKRFKPENTLNTIRSGGVSLYQLHLQSPPVFCTPLQLLQSSTVVFKFSICVMYVRMAWPPFIQLWWWSLRECLLPASYNFEL